MTTLLGHDAFESLLEHDAPTWFEMREWATYPQEWLDLHMLTKASRAGHTDIAQLLVQYVILEADSCSERRERTSR